MKTLLVILFFLFSQFVFSQTIYKSSIDNGGASVSNNDIQLLYTIGEVNVQEVTVGDISISEGFIGPDLFIIENVPPTLVAGADQTVNEGSEVSLDPATFTDPGTSDTHTATIDWGDGSPIELGIVDQAAGTISGDHIFADNGVFTVSVTVTDNHGAESIGTLAVSVLNVAPDLFAGDDQTIDAGSTLSLGLAAFTDPGASDTHTATIDWGDGTPVEEGVVEQETGTISAGHIYAVYGIYTVIVIVVDDDGASASDELVVAVLNEIPPVLSIPADVTIECDLDSDPEATGMATATDNCNDNASISHVDMFVAGCGNTGVITRTWSATDDAGNTVSASQVIAVVDDVPPILNTPFNVTIEFDTPSDPNSLGTATAIDNCNGNVSISHDDVFAGIGNVGVITRTWTAIDECGNTSGSIQTITIVDTSPPIVIVQNINLPLDESGLASLSPENVNNGSSDGSGIASLSVDKTDFNCDDLGTNNVILTVTDINGNSSSATAIVTVLDNTPPVMTIPENVTLECNHSTEPESTGMATAIDNCGENVVISHEDVFVPDCGNSGVITRTWTVSDSWGNTLIAIQTITIVDDTSPVVIVPEDVTIECDMDSEPASTGMATAIDICSENVSISHEDVFVASCGNAVMITRTWTATDECGNSALAIQIISIVDTSAPILSNLDVPIDPVPVGTSVSIALDYEDDNLASAIIDWGDGFQSNANVVEGIITGDYTFVVPGVYVLSVLVQDDCNNESSIVHEYIVVYDPDGGFVTGGGWIHSPPGAYIIDPGLEGKANFGFVAKYKKGSTIPMGNTEFQFKAGDLNFKSTDYDWLVVAGEKAKFKGEGAINQSSNYGFMISAIDGDEKDKPDMFRMKIWEMGSELVVYDNQIESAETADPTTILGGGSITVHDGKADKNKRIAGNEISTEELEALGEISVYPNPAEDIVTVEFGGEGLDQESLDIHLFNLTGVDMLDQNKRYVNNNRMEIDMNDLPAGIYILFIPVGEQQLKYKLTKL